MIIKINRTIACVVLLVVVSIGIALPIVERNNSVSVLSFGQAAERSVIIDAGHGGEDGGAVAEDGTMEKTLNLDIAERLADIFRLAGYNVYMTRDTDNSLSDGGFNKNEDMKARIHMAREHPGALFISIHLNKFSIEKYKGAQIFYSSNHPNSKQLAQSIQSSIQQSLQPDNSRQIKLGDENSILLRLIESPAVIVEGGFLSNREELSRLKTAEYRSKLAFCIFMGVIQFQELMEVK